MASSTRTQTQMVAPRVLHIVTSPAAAAAESSQVAAGAEQHKQVSWQEGTIDNEDMGKKSSKICCIYHKPRAFAESSSSSSDSEADQGAQAASRASCSRKTRKCRHTAGHAKSHRNNSASNLAADRNPDAAAGQPPSSSPQEG